MAVYQYGAHGLWRYDFVKVGRRYTRKGFPSSQKARDAEYDKRRDLDRGLTDACSTFQELADLWLEAGTLTKQPKYLKEVRYRLNRVWAYLAPLHPRAITRGHIEPVLVRMAKTKAPDTVNGYRRDMSAIFNYGVELGVVPFNPVRGIPRVPDRDERRAPVPTMALQALILGADADLQARLIFCAQTGCRWIELARLTWSDVIGGEFPVARLTTRKRRGGQIRQRSQPLTPMALTAIASMRSRDPLYVFPSPRGGPAHYVTDKLHLDKLCQRVGVGRWSWHRIRHWVGMTAARAGKNRRAIADLLGQQSVSATDRYIHAASEEVWSMAHGLERALESATVLAGKRDDEASGV